MEERGGEVSRRINNAISIEEAVPFKLRVIGAGLRFDAILIKSGMVAGAKGRRKSEGWRKRRRKKEKKALGETFFPWQPVDGRGRKVIVFNERNRFL